MCYIVCMSIKYEWLCCCTANKHGLWDASLVGSLIGPRLSPITVLLDAVHSQKLGSDQYLSQVCQSCYVGVMGSLSPVKHAKEPQVMIT